MNQHHGLSMGSICETGQAPILAAAAEVLSLADSTKFYYGYLLLDFFASPTSLIRATHCSGRFVRSDETYDNQLEAHNKTKPFSQTRTTATSLGEAGWGVCV